MASVESIERKLSQLEGGGFYGIEDYVLVRRAEGESLQDAMERMYPGKTDDPVVVDIFQKSMEHTATAALKRAGKL